MELFVETHVWSQDRQKGVQQFVDNRAQHFMVCLFIHSFYFVSYYFLELHLELHMMIFFLNFQETYNSRLRERYGDNPLTYPDFDPDLWMEVGSSGGPDKNRVYGLSNTMAENLRSAHSVSTVGSSPSVSST